MRLVLSVQSRQQAIQVQASDKKSCRRYVRNAAMAVWLDETLREMGIKKDGKRFCAVSWR